MRQVRCVVVAVFGFVMGVTPLHGQTYCDATSPAPAAPSCSRVTTATATVAHILRLQLSSLTTAMLAPDMPQFDSSRVATSLDQLPLTTGPVVTIKSNRAWDLKIVAASATFTFIPDAVYQVRRQTGKPASDLAWSTSPGSGFAPLSSSTPAELLSSSTGGAYTQFTVYYRTRWNYATDVPGTYGLNISYTLVGQ